MLVVTLIGVDFAVIAVYENTQCLKNLSSMHLTSYNRCFASNASNKNADDFITLIFMHHFQCGLITGNA
jgi:hypothetical protein